MVEVRITYASRVFSFPDRAVSVEDIADIMQNSSGGRSVSFSDLQFPVDVAELVAAGHDFARATGEVLVNDVVVLSGSVSEPQYGRGGDPVSLTVSDEPYNDRGAVPSLPVPVPSSASFIVDNTGAYVPFVFGQPCVYTDENGEDHAGIGWPVPVTKRAVVGKAIKELAVFSHTVPAATTATFFNSEGTAQVSTITTSNEIANTAVTSSTTWPASFLAKPPFYCRSSTSIGRDGRAGELIAALLERSTLVIDWGRFAKARGALNRYVLAGYFDAPATPWQLINDHINPILPISWLSSSDGIYPIVWNFEAVPVAEIVNASRVSPVTYEGDTGDLVNEITVNYALDALGGDYLQTVTERDERSIAAWGVAHLSIDCDICSDRDTAYRIARGILSRRAWVHRSVSYEMENPPAVGSLVAVTDDDLHLTSENAIISGVVYGNTPAARVDVLIITKARGS